MKELTEIKIYATGKTDPFIESGTPILQIQNGEVNVGRIVYDLNDEWSLYIDHPENNQELSSLALKLLIDKEPNFLKSDKSIIVFCPKKIAEKMNWR